MSFSDDAIKQIVIDLVDQTVNDAVDTAEGVWANLTQERAAEAKNALRRLAENNLNALRFPDNATYTDGAAHNINTLQSLAAAEFIEVRREARAFIDRVFEKLIDAGFAVIDAAI